MQQINAEAEFDAGKLDVQLQLAVEVEITADGMRALNATIVRAPPKSNSAMADLHVRARAGDRVVTEYVIPDPRLMEVDREGRNTAPQATTFIFVPLDAGLTAIDLIPVKGREVEVSKGGSVNPKFWLRQACEKERELAECQEILRKIGE